LKWLTQSIAPKQVPASRAVSRERARAGRLRAGKKRRWWQAELGQKSGASRPTIARVEANNDVTTATIAKIAQAWGFKLQLK
jgi:hypothetical protein